MCLVIKSFNQSPSAFVSLMFAVTAKTGWRVGWIGVGLPTVWVQISLKYQFDINGRASSNNVFVKE